MAIQVGAILDGLVTGITKFGAFVDVEENRGLVHISEVANEYVEDINTFVKVGDKVKVKVVNVNGEKIALSMKQAQENKPKAKRKPNNKSRHDRDRRKPDVKFEDKISRFLKDSDEKLSMLKKHTESKRGGRGGRRA